MKKLFACLTALVMTCTLSLTALADTRLQDDFYDYVNAAWIETTEIPAASAGINNFTLLNNAVEASMIQAFDGMLDGSVDMPDEVAPAVAIYAMAKDYDTREALGASPILPLLAEIEALGSVAEFAEKWDVLLQEGVVLPVLFDLVPDMADATTYMIYIDAADPMLGVREYYEDEASKAALQSVMLEMFQNLFEMTGMDAETAALEAQQAVDLDERLALIYPYSTEMTGTASYYHPVLLDEADEQVALFDFSKLRNWNADAPDTVSLTFPNYIAQLDDVINDETFPLFKSWLKAHLLVNASGTLTEDIRIEADRLNRVLKGVDSSVDRDKAAWQTTKTICGERVAHYYGVTFFGPEAKAEVTEIVESLVQVYIERMKANTWLGEETKAKAVRKLENMTINVGYNDELSEEASAFQAVSTAEGGNLFTNWQEAVRLQFRAKMQQWGTTPDRTSLTLSPDLVNASYSPTGNSINFPAAVLQAPFYSKEQSAEANYGGIGTAIGHEISHAFDPSGALFDENGTLTNWWTEADYAQFSALTDLMVEQFTVPFAGSMCNGELTVTENVADAGGLSCALEALLRRDGEDVDLREFFTQYASIWRIKLTDAYQQLALIRDVHAPAKLRVNLQLMNIDEFYEAFDIQPGDGMYLEPEKRVKIW